MPPWVAANLGSGRGFFAVNGNIVALISAFHPIELIRIRQAPDYRAQEPTAKACSRPKLFSNGSMGGSSVLSDFDAVGSLRARRYSAPPGYVRTKPPERPKLGPLIQVIDAILEADKTVPSKQRHTAKRIFERLRDEHGFAGG